MTIALTLDVDWAPDFAIEAVADALIQRGLRATWFLTHDSPAIQGLRSYPELFELGIHPNLLPGSSHGATPNEVLAYCLNIVPDAVSLRTHALVQSTPWLFQVARETAITHDVSLFLARRSVPPFTQHTDTRSLVRVPYQWEDDFEMYQTPPCWRPEIICAGARLTVLDFHPIHIWLNSANMGRYQALKTVRPRLQDLVPHEAPPVQPRAEGAGSAFAALLDHMTATGERGTWIRDIGPE